MSRPTKLTDKDMSVLREGDSALAQSRQTSGILKDYSTRHRVELRWDLNPDAIRDKIFIMRIDDTEVLLDAEELQRLVRWI